MDEPGAYVAQERPATAGPGASGRRWRPWADPRLLAYLVAPPAVVVVLVLRHMGLVAPEPAWLWLVVFAANPGVSAPVDMISRRWPGTFSRHLRIAAHVACVTAVIYLTGWGPVLVGSYAFVAVENIAWNGSRAWRSTASWSVAAVVVAQLLVAAKVVPSFLSDAHAQAVALMGAFVLVFVIRMAAATMEKKEEAETSMQASERRFRSLVQHSSDTTLVLDADLHITHASPAVEALLGRSPAELLGVFALDLVHPDDVALASTKLAADLQVAPTTEPAQFRMRHADGRWRDVEAIVTDLRGEPAVGGHVANIRDITDRKAAEALLVQQALHDPLTGLPNRTVVLDRAEQMVRRAKRSGEPVAAMYVDLDDFKEINDSLGHEAGDHVLKTVGARLVAEVRGDDTVGRMGGDEFVILVERGGLPEGLEPVVERLRRTVGQPIRLPDQGTVVQVTASIGAVEARRDSAQQLLSDADTALYQAKAAGKDRSAIFEEAMGRAVHEARQLKRDLRAALGRDEYVLCYQPVVDLASEAITGVEALLRWRHPSRGVLLPEAFIPLLEETGAIVDVGRWVLRRACAQAVEWDRRNLHLAMSVNVSRVQLNDPRFVEHVGQALDATGLDGHRLTIEITEGAVQAASGSGLVGRLDALRGLGVRVALDDFGTGWPSLSALRQLPVDAIKIDRSFVTADDDTGRSAALVRTLVQLGRNLGLDVYAEGIEEAAQLTSLRSHRCARGQGFLFSPPVDPEQVEALASERASAGPDRRP